MFTARSAKRAAAPGSRLAPGSVQQAQGSTADQAFDTQLLVHAGALLTTARADSVVLLLVLVCFVKARPLTPYQAAALGNLTGSVLTGVARALHYSAWRSWLAYCAGPVRPDVSLEPA